MTSPLLTKNNGEIVLFLNSFAGDATKYDFRTFSNLHHKSFKETKNKYCSFFGRIMKMVSPPLAEDNAGIYLFSGLV